MKIFFAFLLCVTMISAQGKIVQPKIINKVAPEYPENAKKLRVEAQIYLNTFIGTDGIVKETELMQANVKYPGETVTLLSIDDLKKVALSHRNSVAKLLEVSQQTAKKWKFKPATVDGVVQESMIVLPFSFTLLNQSNQPLLPPKE